jgi:hypothetical protein
MSHSSQSQPPRWFFAVEILGDLLFLAHLQGSGETRTTPASYRSSYRAVSIGRLLFICAQSRLYIVRHCYGTAVNTRANG